MTEAINDRKSEHIRITLEEKVTGNQITTGYERIRFVHNALPEIHFEEMSIATTFFKQPIKTPFLISSMTGGTELAGSINRHLAEAAEARGWIFALGSTRALLESEGHHQSFKLRSYAPTVPIIANLGAVQLNYGFDTEKCKRIIDITEANALVLHLNSLQEVIQPEGNRNFADLLPKIEVLCKELDVPVGVKEVGWGIDGRTAASLIAAGISFIDVAGAGGTSWSQVEKFRTTDPIRKQAAQTFEDWGIPTVDCLHSVRARNQDIPLIASGGTATGLDAAKALAIGADIVGFGRALLHDAMNSTEAVLQMMETRELELKIAMFGIGAATIPALQHTNRVLWADKRF